MSLDRLAAALSDRYRVERELGQGGMATVYLAHDLKHQRDVAIKVLHPDLGAAIGGERFLSEIRTTARLQHPHILPLLDSGAADGLLYYVMPYVSGETLRDRLDRERQLPIEDVIQIAREVADALGAAHALGIIHRDIKPDNILLQGGHAVVADFGIALAVQEAGGARMTQTGLSLGTPQYMSPEQAMGERTIDARSDIYALGAVTFEMLTGEPPFSGATAQAVVAKVLTEKPPRPSAVRDTVPASVEAAVLKALAKLPADRWPSTAKFAEGLVPGEPSVRAGAVRSAVPRRIGMQRGLAAVVAIVALMASAWWLGRTGSRAPAGWTSYTQLTDGSGEESAPSLSPDGESFAFTSNVRGSWDIYVQRVGGRNPILVAGDSTLDERWPAYSPDGRQIVYSLGGGGLFLVGATGESARRLTSVGSNPSWSPDGTQVVFGSEAVVTPYQVYGTGALWIVPVSGGEPRLLLRTEAGGGYQPAWSPSGRRIAFWSARAGQRDLETIAVTGGATVKVTDDVAVDWAPTWSPDGRALFFASDRGGTMGLWRIGIDEATGQATGAPELVVAGVDVSMDLPQLSRDGASIIFRSKLESVNPAAIAFDPVAERVGTVRLLQRRSGILAPSDISPDGAWLALYNSPDRQQDLFVMRPDGSELTRLTDDPARDWNPRFTPDGEALTFHSNQSGIYEGWLLRRDGSGRTRLTDFGGAGVVYPMFAPDGQRLMVERFDSIMPVVGSSPWPLTRENATVLAGAALPEGDLNTAYWSRDGRWFSGGIQSAFGGIQGNGLYEVATGRITKLSDDAYGDELAWLPGYRRVVYFTGSGALVVQDVESLVRRVLSPALPYPPDQLGSIVAAPDGRTLYYGARQIESNIWMVRRAPRVGSR
ncbi:MAG: protein kinase [Gemmatimonadota bacterium]|nr:protein kinase [Gemmatimonadota bacterium]